MNILFIGCENVLHKAVEAAERIRNNATNKNRSPFIERMSAPYSQFKMLRDLKDNITIWYNEEDS